MNYGAASSISIGTVTEHLFTSDTTGCPGVGLFLCAWVQNVKSIP